MVSLGGFDGSCGRDDGSSAVTDGGGETGSAFVVVTLPTSNSPIIPRVFAVHPTWRARGPVDLIGTGSRRVYPASPFDDPPLPSGGRKQNDWNWAL